MDGRAERVQLTSVLFVLENILGRCSSTGLLTGHRFSVPDIY
jgi:hypothetical protein